MIPILRKMLLLIIGGLSCARAEPLGMVEVERAHYIETTLGDLDEALEVYRRVSEGQEFSRRSRAEATFGMARCYDSTERYTLANRYFLKVVKESGEFEDLANRAGEEILVISKLLADEGGAVSGEEDRILTDSSKALNAFVLNGELPAAVEVCAVMEELLGSIRESVRGTPDEEPIESLAKEVAEISKLAEAGAAKSARQAVSIADELDRYIGSSYLRDPGELYSPALRWKDKVATALAENSAASAEKFCAKIVRYLAPFESLPLGEERAHAKIFTDQAKLVAALVKDGKMAEARLAFHKNVRSGVATNEGFAVYLEGYDDKPIALLPRLNVVHSWIEVGIEAVDVDTVEARSALEKALRAAQLLKEGDAAEAEELTGVVEKMLAAIDEGRAGEVQEIYEEDESE